MTPCDRLEKQRVAVAKYRAAHPERVAEYRARYRAANKDKIAAYNAANKDKIAAWHAADYVAKKEHYMARATAWRVANPERTKAQDAIRYARLVANKAECLSARNRRRRAQKRDLLIEAPKRSAIWARTGGVCHLCIRPVPYDSAWHADHVIPLRWGGVEHLDNLALAHAKCNMSKKAKHGSAIRWVEQVAWDVSGLFHLGEYRRV